MARREGKGPWQLQGKVCKVIIEACVLIVLSDENGGDAEPEIEIIPGYDGAEPQFGRFKGWTAVAQMIPGKLVLLFKII